MDEEIVVPAMFFITIIVLVIVVPIIKAWYNAQEAKLKQPQLTPELSARLDRLETMVETVAIEVERMAEGQRFTTKLLSEGAALPVSSSHDAAQRHPASPDGSVTHA